MTREQLAISRFRALMDAAVDAIILIDCRGLILDCNHAGERMFGYSIDQIRGRNISMLMPEPFHQEHDGYLKRYLETREARIIGIGREVVARRADGVNFPIDLAVGEVLEAGEVIGFAGFIRDLTAAHRMAAALRAREAELQESRDRLMHAGRLGTLGEMAAGIAHEMNQPLTAIANYARASARLLQQTPPALEMLADTLGKIATQAERAGEVIQGLRGFMRGQSLPKQTLDLSQLLRDFEPLLGIESRGENLQVEVKSPDTPAWVKGDPVQLQQVILNLVRNSVDAMAEGGGHLIAIRLERHGREWWRLEVEDQGPGLDPAIAQELFHPFVTSKPQGVGLGLSICNTIIEDHGGGLSCTMSQPGQTIFQVVLPALRSETLHG